MKLMPENSSVHFRKNYRREEQLSKTDVEVFLIEFQNGSST